MRIHADLLICAKWPGFDEIMLNALGDTDRERWLVTALSLLADVTTCC